MLNRIIPDVTLKTRVRDATIEGPNPFRWKDLNVREAFDGKKVVVDNNDIVAWFEVPGINDAGTDEDPYGQTAPEKVLEALKGGAA
ncbi:MAG: hypothetical protein ABIT04_12430 [Novosphingobium sp.]